MASLNQLVSEMAHSLGQPNNTALRENLKLLIIHTRNEIIRHSYENHNYMDKGLQQRVVVSVKEVNDGDVILPEEYNGGINLILRTEQKVPRPVRLVNNLPFMRVSTRGFKTNVEIPFIKETSARFKSVLPGMRGLAAYDYINEYLYIFPSDCNDKVRDLKKIVIEAPFEHPTEIVRLNNEGAEYQFMDDDNEWLLSEDMIGQIKDIIIKRDLLQNHRETNEIPNVTKLR